MPANNYTTDKSEANFNQEELKYLNLLSEKYPNLDIACTEIINLKAMLGLPKKTEHFLSDIHGEDEHFIHILKNASGVIKRNIDELFESTLTYEEKKALATLIYYPEQKLEIIKIQEKNIKEWYKINLYKLIEICKFVSSSYTRLQVREVLPVEFSHIIEELLHEKGKGTNKNKYYNEIIETIIELDKAKDFIISLSELIQKLSIYRMHIIGDIYDRGKGAENILDKLMEFHSVDIQWGNHDIQWMAAASGSEACISNVLRISLRYANLRTLETGYGINILPLATFSMEYYANDPCNNFKPKFNSEDDYSKKEIKLMTKMHKAITIIQLKLEGEIIKRRPEYQMKNRLLLNKINYDEGTIELDGKEYTINDINFPTISPENPYELIPEEKEVIEKLKSSFINSDKLQKHTRFLFSKGGMYKIYNNNLLYHGCITTLDSGEFSDLTIKNKKYSCKNLLDKIEQIAREGYYAKDETDKRYGLDMMWYLWSGSRSPLFGKTKMATFERYFIDDKETHTEEKNPYYKFRDDEKYCNKILKEFGLDPKISHIINGHVPVKVKKGEKPIKANGKLLVIDGAFSKAYQDETGTAGYTLIYNSYGLILAAHEPFESIQKAIDEEADIVPETFVFEKSENRLRISDTDEGIKLKQKIDDLYYLLKAYRKGIIKEQK